MNDWRTCPSFPEYEVSTDGRIRRGDRELKLHTSADGYLALRLSVGGKTALRKIHRLVAETFIPNPSAHPLVDHINRNKTDNRVDNLRWATKRMNAINSARCDGEQRGIMLYRNRYQVRIGQTYLGRYRTLEEAMEVRRNYLALQQ